MTLNTTEQPKLTNRFEQALVYANRLHAHQIRKGSGVAYISHLLSVAALVIENGGDEDEAIAGLLHDAIEDQGGATTREAIRQQFGERVTEIVNGCTDADTIPKPPWKERKQKYIEHLRHASSSVCRVSLCDKLHNARSILSDWRREGDAVWDRFTGSKTGTLWYYRAIVQVFQEIGSNSHLVDELNRVVCELEKG
jgi:(p)ppGpp synthase/HD superfamily hydrolase